MLVELRCPACFAWSQAPCTRRELAELDRQQAAARQLLLDAYDRCVAESMEALGQCLGAALALDLIDADDFSTRASRRVASRRSRGGRGAARGLTTTAVGGSIAGRGAWAGRWRAARPAPAPGRATSRRRGPATGARPGGGATARSVPSPRGGARAACAAAAAARADGARRRALPPRGGRRGRPRRLDRGENGGPTAPSTSARTASAGGSANRSREGTTTAAAPGSSTGSSRLIGGSPASTRHPLAAAVGRRPAVVGPARGPAVGTASLAPSLARTRSAPGAETVRRAVEARTRRRPRPARPAHRRARRAGSRGHPARARASRAGWGSRRAGRPRPGPPTRAATGGRAGTRRSCAARSARAPRDAGEMAIRRRRGRACPATAVPSRRRTSTGGACPLGGARALSAMGDPRDPPARAPLPARDRGEDRDLVAVGDRRLESLEEADVLAAEVDVDEAPQLAVVAGDPLAQLAVLRRRARRAPRRPFRPST